MLNIIRQSIAMSLDNIRSNKMRSFLTMLGIVIGVSSVIGLITIMEGATGMMMEELSGLGAGTITISTPGTALKRGLTERDVEELSEIEGVTGVAPSVSETISAVYGGEIYDKVTMKGRDILFFSNNDKMIMSGRAFIESETDGSVNVCVVDETFVKKVMRGNSPLGREVLLDGINYTVIGVSGEDNSISGGFTDDSQSQGEVIVPYKNMLRRSGTNILMAEIFVEEGYESSKVESDLRNTLNMIFNNAKDSFSVLNMESLMKVYGTVTKMMTGLLVGIASIALVVGGIGIMNMMLVSVTERTKEIGLRKALGAEPSRIQLQFLIESICLSLIGGIIGIILGLVIAAIGAKLIETDFVISYSAIAIGAGFSTAVGIVFGWMPARRASTLNPIDALRSE